ncbi:hypothetical protein [Streptomyces sp. NPDC001137]|uniref:hypothetical protein n=1 Tax=Streptomyces sp. NPDC001137 TaxID=3154378 RepID=UPI00331F6365
MRGLLRRAVLLGMLVLIVVLSGFVLDLQQIAAPRPAVSNDVCRPSPIINESNTAGTCRWGHGKPYPVHIDIQEADDGSFRVKASVSLPASSSTVRRVVGGEAAADPVSFADQVFGFIGRDNYVLAWTAPVVTITDRKAGADSAGQRVTVTTTGTDRLLPAPSSRLTLSGDGSSSTGTVTVTTQHRVITGRSGLTPSRQDARHLTARPGDRGWKVVAAPGSPVQPGDGLASGLKAPSWWTGTVQVLSSAWQALRDATPALLAAVPWAVLLLMGRAGPSRPAWRHFLALTGLLLTWHLALTLAQATQQVDNKLSDVLINPAIRHLEGALHWNPMSYVSEAGSLVILIAGLLSVLPTAARGASFSDTTRPRPAYWGARIMAAAAGATACFYSGILIELQQPARTPSRSLVLVQLGTLVLLGLGAWAGARLWHKLRRRGGPSMPALGFLIAVAIILNTIAPLRNFGGYLPWLMRWGVVLGTGAAALLVLVQLTARELNQLRTPEPVGHGLPRWAWPILTLCALALVVPWDLRTDAGQGWFHLLNFAQALDGLLAPLAVLSGIIALRSLGDAPVTSTGALRRHLVMGRVTAFLVLTSSYTFFHTASVWALGAAAASVWMLLPANSVSLAVHALGQGANDRQRAMSITVAAGAARRQLPGARKIQRDHDGTAEDARKNARRIRTLELVATQDRHVRRRSHQPQPTAQQAAFGSFVSRRPWSRAKSCALAGGLIGLPWTILDLVGSADLHPGGPYPLLTAVGTLLPALLRWAGYGFLFGYFYPLLRGSTGLAKALWLSAAAVGPTLLDLLLTPASVPVWTRMVVSVLQLATFAMTLGLWSDQQVLAQHSYHLSRLADVHNLGSLTTWASTVTAAFGAGIAALLLVGAQPFVTGLVQPPSLPTPPPTAPSTGSAS